MKNIKIFDFLMWIIAVGTMIVLKFTTGGSFVALASSTIGITGIILNYRGWKHATLLMTVAAMLYAFVAFSNKLYGEAIINLVICAPIYIVGYIKRLRDSTKSLIVEIYRINLKQLLFFAVGAIVTIIFYGKFLEMIGSELPYLNAATTALCVISTYLTSRMILECWIIWNINNAILIVIWIISLVNGGTEGYMMLLQFSVYSVINFIGYFRWRKLYSYLVLNDKCNADG